MPESPFTPVYSRQSFVETPGLAEALRRLDDGLGAREPFLVVTGGPGIGKTALASEAVQRWGSRVTAAVLAYPALTGAELLEEVLRRFGAEPPDGASRSKLVACVERALADVAARGQVALLVVDDAHDLSLELLEELRLLANAAQQARRPLEILLVGLPALGARLDEPKLAALRQRVSVQVKLEPLSPTETKSYLHHRVTAAGGDGPTLFSRKTCRDIAARTRGVPRQINALAAEALRVAKAWGDQTVGAEHVQTAAAGIPGLAPAGVLDEADADESRPKGAAATTPAPAAAPAPTTAPPPVKAETAAPSPTRAAAPDAPIVARPSKPPPTPPVSPAPAAMPKPLPPMPAWSAPTPPPRQEPPPKPEPIRAKAPPAPPAPPAESAPAAKPPGAPRLEESAVPNPSIPTQDPREWVARFVGDKGPLQIGSMASLGSFRSLDLPETGAGDSALSPETPRLPQPKKRSRPGLKLPVSPRLAMTSALAAIAAITAVVLLIRAGSRATRNAGQTTEATASAEPESATTQSTKSSDTPSRGAKSSSAARVSEPRVDTSGRSRGPFTLDVGAYSDLQTALDERYRMQELTGFEGWVVTESGGAGETYRIVVGIYRSRERAQSAANMLLRSRTLRDVTVVPMPPRSIRR